MSIQPISPVVVQTPTPQSQGNRSDAISQAVSSGQAQRAQSQSGTTALAQQAVKAPAEVDRQALEAAAKKIERFVAPMASSLKFSIDEESGLRVVMVIDDSTKEVIRQMPSEEVVAIARALESLQGLLFREKA